MLLLWYEQAAPFAAYWGSYDQQHEDGGLLIEQGFWYQVELLILDVVWCKCGTKLMITAAYQVSQTPSQDIVMNTVYLL